MMYGHFATSSIKQINGMAPRVSAVTVIDGQSKPAPDAPARGLARSAWIALLSLLFATGVGLGTGEIMSHLFAESWSAAGLYGI